MRLKNFVAPNMSQAMLMVKEALGDEAIIISNQSMDDGKIQITAALEDDLDFNFDIKDEIEIIEHKNTFDDTTIRESLDYHSVLDATKDKILALSRKASAEKKISDSRLILESVFSQMFGFQDILHLSQPVKMFMGVAGSGKSTAIAKVATHAKFNKMTSCIISTDNVRAGANNQLEAFARILEVPFAFVKTESELFQKVEEAKVKYHLVLIDTPGVNPFISEELERLKSLAKAVPSDIIMTIDAGKNTYEAVEIAENFSEIGVKYIMPTRLDLTRRIGSLISVASCCKLNFCSASVSSSIAKGLSDINAKSLTKLILS